jgi:hypothetical protein
VASQGGEGLDEDLDDDSHGALNKSLSRKSNEAMVETQSELRSFTSSSDDDAQRTFWGGVHAARSSAEVQDLLAEPRADVVLLGPEGVGKSSLLAALRRACEPVDPDGFGIRFRLVDLADLEAEAITALRERRPIQPTLEPRLHTFQCELPSGGPTDPEVTQLEFVFRDLPGEWAFPSSGLPDRERLRAACRWATALVLVADAAEPALELWERNLPHLLEALASPSDQLVWRASALARSRNAEYPLKRELEVRWPFPRVLVLLSKIDAAVESAVAAVDSEWNRMPAARDDTTGQLANLTPVELAAELSAIHQAEHALGIPLQTLRAALLPTAQLAVGFASAWGFRDPRTPPYLDLSTPPDSAWTPFGLREAIWFLATGNVRAPFERVESTNGPLLPTRLRWIEVEPVIESEEGSGR